MPNKSSQNQIAQEKVATVFKDQLIVALKAIDRLGIILQGNHKKFDQTLVKLRKSLQTSEDFLDLDMPLEQLIHSVTALENNYSEGLRGLHQETLVAGSSLQKTKGLDDELRRQLRMIVNRLKSSDGTIVSELRDNITAILSLYVKANGIAKTDNEEISANSISTNDADSSAIVSKAVDSGTNNLTDAATKYNEDMINKLVAGLQQLSGSEIIKPSLDVFVDRIKVTNDSNVKLDICLQYFEEIVDRIVEEFSQTQSLISKINVALADVHNTLIVSLKNSKNYDSQIAKLNAQIDTQIKSLSNSTQDANSLGDLKDAIDSKLSIINRTILKRDQIEATRTSKLQDAVDKMEAKLSSLEQRTEYYRQKWLEEKTRSGIDTLTNLPNRGSYDKKISEEFQRWSRQPMPLSVAVLDIDHFKSINDKFGHSVGDKTLKIVSHTLRKQLRATDFLARYGGEEFVAIFINSDSAQVVEPLEKLRKAVEKIPFKVKDTPLNITISIGYTTFVDADNVHTAFDRADKALYEAKHSGRNRVCFK
jgi:diguanylate cyclase